MNLTEKANYEQGYTDGLEGNPRSNTHVGPSYDIGYADGTGDAALQVRIEDRKEVVRPVDEDYYQLNDPPAGFIFTGEKRTPKPGDWYLSKNGNAIECLRIRGNNQKRHILKRS